MPQIDNTLEKRPVIMYDEATGERIDRFESCWAASRMHAIHAGTICQVASGQKYYKRAWSRKLKKYVTFKYDESNNSIKKGV